MPLFVSNLTGTNVTLSGMSVVVPASASPPDRGESFNVTSELSGLSSAQYAVLEVQRPDVLDYTWSNKKEYNTGTLLVLESGRYAVRTVNSDSTPIFVTRLSNSLTHCSILVCGSSGTGEECRFVRDYTIRSNNGTLEVVNDSVFVAYPDYSTDAILAVQIFLSGDQLTVNVIGMPSLPMQWVANVEVV